MFAVLRRSVKQVYGAHLNVITPRQQITFVDAEAVANRLQRCARFGELGILS